MLAGGWAARLDWRSCREVIVNVEADQRHCEAVQLRPPLSELLGPHLHFSLDPGAPDSACSVAVDHRPDILVSLVLYSSPTDMATGSNENKEHFYPSGHDETVLRSHRTRTAANSAAHLLPLLRKPDKLLDIGFVRLSMPSQFAPLSSYPSSH